MLEFALLVSMYTPMYDNVKYVCLLVIADGIFR